VAAGGVVERAGGTVPVVDELVFLHDVAN
jgi:hypothetical protein